MIDLFQSFFFSEHRLSRWMVQVSDKLQVHSWRLEVQRRGQLSRQFRRRRPCLVSKVWNWRMGMRLRTVRIFWSLLLQQVAWPMFRGHKWASRHVAVLSNCCVCPSWKREQKCSVTMRKTLHWPQSCMSGLLFCHNPRFGVSFLKVYPRKMAMQLLQRLWQNRQLRWRSWQMQYDFCTILVTCDSVRVLQLSVSSNWFELWFQLQKQKRPTGTVHS